MNKITFLFYLIICLGVGGSASAVSAQTGDKVLAAAGKKTLRQSEVNKLIEFYEWAFEANFTGEQRDRFGEYTTDEFRSDPAASRSTIDDVINTLPRILAADHDLQATTRKNFLAVFLVQARKNTDENSQMLLSIYESARGAKSDESASAADNSNNDSKAEEDSSNSSVGSLSALVGKWSWGRSGSKTTTTSGVYLGGNASRHTYQFFSNGTVEYVGIMNIMTGGCRMQVFRAAKGKARINGDTLTINWSPASFSRDDSCSPSKNYKKTLPAETETFQVKLKTDYGQKQICLTGKDETCYSSASN